MEPKIVKFSRRLTGYCSKDTNFTISQKFQGNAPDITIYQSGKFDGNLTLDARAARELAKTLMYLCGDEKK